MTPEEKYEPFGVAWEIEMTKLTKKELIAKLRRLLMSKPEEE